MAWTRNTWQVLERNYRVPGLAGTPAFDQEILEKILQIQSLFKDQSLAMRVSFSTWIQTASSNLTFWGCF